MAALGLLTLGLALIFATTSTTASGNWITIQRRVAGDYTTDFYKNWNEYKLGFGDFSGSFWTGLDRIHSICNSRRPCELRFDMRYRSGPLNPDYSIHLTSDSMYYAQYSHFYISGESDGYRLNVSGYSGTASDSWFSACENGDACSCCVSNGRKFSTYDKNNPSDSHINCGTFKKSGWWMYGRCTDSNPNGVMGSSTRPDSDYSPASWYGLTDWHNAVDKIEMRVSQKAN